MYGTNTPTINMLTATEALAQGATPSTFFSIARFNERLAAREEADADRSRMLATGQAARRVARELAQLLGMDLGGRRRAANSTRGTEYGKPRGDRRAA